MRADARAPFDEGVRTVAGAVRALGPEGRRLADRRGHSKDPRQGRPAPLAAEDDPSTATAEAEVLDAIDAGSLATTDADGSEGSDAGPVGNGAAALAGTTTAVDEVASGVCFEHAASTRSEAAAGVIQLRFILIPSIEQLTSRHRAAAPGTRVARNTPFIRHRRSWNRRANLSRRCVGAWPLRSLIIQRAPHPPLLHRLVRHHRARHGALGSADRRLRDQHRGAGRSDRSMTPAEPMSSAWAGRRPH